MEKNNNDDSYFIACILKVFVRVYVGAPCLAKIAGQTECTG
ncbi:group II intron reverse transcriptase/maturase [Acetobacter orientalis]|uniref:Group II intron reverse transcriptase/maturase n=1 Tax=Acetobacter orientalis TaxID=146474 RepID=A0A2Z5ZD64_9PROT|nr:group II intron reverse transcriptase/maturase [Acetobacter orientalis]